jgi:biopolymer transport protein ExbD
MKPGAQRNDSEADSSCATPEFLGFRRDFAKSRRVAQYVLRGACLCRMAMIDVGGGSGQRAVNRELTLVPFIDFLLCIVAFLLVTAVWSHMSRLDVQANVPGETREPRVEAPQPTLHVDMRQGDRFVVEWRQGNTVLGQSVVSRKDTTAAPGVLRFPALADEVKRLWSKDGMHRSVEDAARDRAVLHASNAASFDEIVAGMDAIRATWRAVPGGGSAPAFDVVFAVD